MAYLLMFLGAIAYECFLWLKENNPVKGLTHNENTVLQYRQGNQPKTERRPTQWHV